MPRRRRILCNGEIHHVMSRGLDGMEIFDSDDVRERFVCKLRTLLRENHCLCYGWCLMPNHYHLVLRPLDTQLDSIMRRLNGSYARQFNKIKGRRGYVFQDRYKSIATQNFTYIRELIRYVHLNPLRAGVVSSIDNLEKYRWSGHRALMGLEDCPWMSLKETLTRFSPHLHRAREVYRAFLVEGIERGGTFETIWDEIRTVTHESGMDSRFGDGRIVGEPEFVNKMVARYESEEIKLKKLRENRPELSAILKTVCEQRKITEAAELIKGRKQGRRLARDEFCYLAYKRYGYPLSLIGAFLGIQPTTVYMRASSILPE
jgi:putative transposase